MDRQLKSLNNMILDMKEEREKDQAQISRLLIYKDDHETLMLQQEKKLREEYKEEIELKERIANDAR